MELPHNNYDLILTPSGRLKLVEIDGANAAFDAWMRRVAAGFSSSTAEGLIALAVERPSEPPPPVFSYWRDFSCLYMTQLCRLPEFAGKKPDPIEPPAESEISTMFLSAPPMHGGEYLNPEIFIALWVELDLRVRSEIAEHKEGLAGWLKDRAPIWRQVGRVCFHLAENKQDPEFPFAFLATYAPSLSKGGKVQYKPLGTALKEYAGERNKKALINLLSPVHRASEKVEFVRELVESGDIFHPIAWTPQEAYRLLKSVALLEESGLLVRIPDWWRNRPRPRVAVTIGEKNPGRLGAKAILDFRVSLALGDQRLTEAELNRIMEAEDGLSYVKGQWIEIDREKLSMALNHWKKVEAEAQSDGISFIQGMRMLAGAPADLGGDAFSGAVEREWSFVNAGKWLSDVLSELNNPGRAAQEAGAPEGFCGTLRHYQEKGRNWLLFLTKLGLGACLADDMGLGKTIQVLSLLLTIKQSSSKPSLLVLPASLLANWKAEIKRFAPTLRACFIHPSEMEAASLAAIVKDPGSALEQTDLALTTYGMLLRQKWLFERDWRLVILDEAQAIKNPGSHQTRAVKRLKADVRIALTGTPVENRLSDLWSLFDFICPGLLGSTSRFKQFVKNLDERSSDRYAPLRNLVRPYILRRLKTDRSIIADLPEKTEMKAFCGLAKKQAALYAKSVEDLSLALQTLEGMKRRGLILTYLMKLKQICNHPSQFSGDGQYDSADSGKFERLRQICEEIASRQERAIIFTQFREITEPIADFVGGLFGREGLVLHGGTEVKRRKALIDAFQRDEGPPFMVLSLKAGGTGLNLTAASHVIHFDRWWNPAVENQATDRAFRIGQKKNVIVHKFICRGTVEEKIDALMEDKTNLAEDILKAGAESMLTEMSNDELLKVVALDINRAEI
ncbi:MAG: ATP-dependent helicase [Deltaproteobacteria bacterium CG_4_8_14_3_um_filter_51_11]|nr:DEAD/DEAH box helicase [bacterium]OIP41659.1 MAG: ATP-dependent helicase [Desulfobacteraceae bacterium CG2_30_51_40]PIP46179.1 MAG: ATP-dependent helicase [Deltaproteobacteria bacterium CG23_combo_of_CG06-09_8_20_14_all_51_20]PIX18126.1 MAG: ATP-dependent helicase [Deltaproteobacteria bacterium CG_4_8_14_3_um_filter_51_11]PIY22577.1 MAG: ATP-dependent helicase [Deltaproteobacteria bacterium CG_4_10_14_3_um_filter_51_14]PJB34185.1 MAG: ATP-dependent helicase [Deltaproteobacteria bacterium CG